MYFIFYASRHLAPDCSIYSGYTLETLLQYLQWMYTSNFAAVFTVDVPLKLFCSIYSGRALETLLQYHRLLLYNFN